MSYDLVGTAHRGWSILRVTSQFILIPIIIYEDMAYLYCVTQKTLCSKALAIFANVWSIMILSYDVPADPDLWSTIGGEGPWKCLHEDLLQILCGWGWLYSVGFFSCHLYHCRGTFVYHTSCVSELILILIFRDFVGKYCCNWLVDIWLVCAL